MNIVFGSILPGVLVALTTAYFTSRFYVHHVRADLEREYASRFNERKWTAYRQFALLLKDVLLSTKAGRGNRDQNKHLRGFYEFLPEI